MKDTKMNRKSNDIKYHNHKDKNWNNMKDTKKLISSETLIRNYDNGFNDGIRKAIEIIGLDDNKCYQSCCYGCVLDLKQLLEKELK